LKKKKKKKLKVKGEWLMQEQKKAGVNQPRLKGSRRLPISQDIILPSHQVVDGLDTFQSDKWHKNLKITLYLK
jgi:hypothetical protein